MSPSVGASCRRSQLSSTAAPRSVSRTSCTSRWSWCAMLWFTISRYTVAITREAMMM
jgi:hypothetical protein